MKKNISEISLHIVLIIIISEILSLSSANQTTSTTPNIIFRAIKKFPKTFSLYTNEYIKLDLAEYFEGLHLQIDHFTNTSLAEAGVLSFDPGIKVLRKFTLYDMTENIIILSSYLSPLIKLENLTKLLWIFNDVLVLELYDISIYTEVKLLRSYKLDKLIQDKLNKSKEELYFLTCNQDALVNMIIDSGYQFTVGCSFSFTYTYSYLSTVTIIINSKGKPEEIQIEPIQYKITDYGLSSMLSTMIVKKSSQLKVMLYSCVEDSRTFYEYFNATSLYILDMNSDFDLAFSTLKGSILAVLSPDFFNKTNICLNDIFVKDNLIYTTDVLNSKLYVISVKPNTLEFELSTEIDLKHGGGKIIFAEFIGNEELVINCRNDTYGKSTVYQFRIEANKRFIETEVLGRPYELPAKAKIIGKLVALTYNYIIASYNNLALDLMFHNTVHDFLHIYQRNSNQFRSNIYDIDIDEASACMNIQTYNLFDDIILITEERSFSFVQLAQPSFVINTFHLSFPILDDYSKTPMNCSFYVKNDINNYIYQICQLYLINEKTTPFYAFFTSYDIFKFQGVSSTFLVQNLFKGQFQSLSYLQINGTPGINIEQKPLISLRDTIDLPMNLTMNLRTYLYIYSTQGIFHINFLGNISTVSTNCMILKPSIGQIYPECDNPNYPSIINPISNRLKSIYSELRMSIFEPVFIDNLLKIHLISDGTYNLYYYSLGRIFYVLSKLTLQFYPSDIIFGVKYWENINVLIFSGVTNKNEGVIYVMNGTMVANKYFNLALISRIRLKYKEIPIQVEMLFNRIFILFANQYLNIYEYAAGYLQLILSVEVRDYKPLKLFVAPTIKLFVAPNSRTLYLFGSNRVEIYMTLNKGITLINSYETKEWNLYMYENNPLMAFSYHIIGIYYKETKMGKVYSIKLFNFMSEVSERYTFEAGSLALHIKSKEIICGVQLVDSYIIISTNLRIIVLNYAWQGNRLIISSPNEMFDYTRKGMYWVYPTSVTDNPNINIDIPSVILNIYDQPSNILISPYLKEPSINMRDYNNANFNSIKLIESGDILLDTYISGFNMSINISKNVEYNDYNEEKRIQVNYGLIGNERNTTTAGLTIIIDVLLVKPRQELHIFDNLGVTIYNVGKTTTNYQATCLYGTELGDIIELKAAYIEDEIYIFIVSVSPNGIQLLQILYFEREDLSYSLVYKIATPIVTSIEVTNNKAGMFYSKNALTFSMHIFTVQAESEFVLKDLNSTLPFKIIANAKISNNLELPVVYILSLQGITIINYNTSKILRTYEMTDFLFAITFEEPGSDLKSLIVNYIGNYEEQVIIVCVNQIILEFIFKFTSECDSVEVLNYKAIPRYGEEGIVSYINTDGSLSAMTILNQENDRHYLKLIRFAGPPKSIISTQIISKYSYDYRGIRVSEDFFNSTGLLVWIYDASLSVQVFAPHPFLQVPNTFSNHPHMITIDAYNKFSSYSFNLTIKSNIFVKQSFLTILLVFIFLGVLIGIWVGSGVYKKRKREEKIKRLQSINIDLYQKGLGESSENGNLKNSQKEKEELIEAGKNKESIN